VAATLDLDRVYRQCECSATVSPTDFENVEMAVDQAYPNERSEQTAKNAFEGAWS
jgi:hypothetical protein